MATAPLDVGSTLLAALVELLARLRVADALELGDPQRAPELRRFGCAPRAVVAILRRQVDAGLRLDDLRHVAADRLRRGRAQPAEVEDDHGQDHGSRDATQNFQYQFHFVSPM